MVTPSAFSLEYFPDNEFLNFSIFCHLGGLTVSQIISSGSFYFNNFSLNSSLSSQILLQAARINQATSSTLS